jgi:hypothetical protein
VNVKPGGTYSNHWALEGFICFFKQSQFTCHTFKHPFIPDHGILVKAFVGGGGYRVGTNFNVLNPLRAASQISKAFVLLSEYFVRISINNEPRWLIVN